MECSDSGSGLESSLIRSVTKEDEVDGAQGIGGGFGTFRGGILDMVFSFERFSGSNYSFILTNFPEMESSAPENFFTFFHFFSLFWTFFKDSPLYIVILYSIIQYQKGGENELSEKEIKSLVLRLPLNLYNRIKEVSEASRLSINQVIINALDDLKEVPTIEMRIKAIESRLDEIEKQIKK